MTYNTTSAFFAEQRDYIVDIDAGEPKVSFIIINDRFSYLANTTYINSALKLSLIYSLTFKDTMWYLTPHDFYRAVIDNNLDLNLLELDILIAQEQIKLLNL